MKTIKDVEIKLLLLLIIMLSLSPMGVYFSTNVTTDVTTENLAEVQFIGTPQYSLIDLDNNGDWDMIRFNQTVNITKVGSGPLVMNSGVYLSASNNTFGESLIEGDSLEGGLVNSSKIGPIVITKWILRPYEKLFSGFDSYNISWTPTLQPADSNLKLSSLKYEGTPVKITFDNTKQYRPAKFSFTNASDVTGDISPAYTNVITNKTVHRTIGEQYTWNITGFGNSSFIADTKLAVGVTDYINSTISLTVSNLTNELFVKPKINNSIDLNETLTGYPYSYAFIPINISQSKLLDALSQNFAQFKLIGLAYNGSMTEMYLNESNGFFGYSVLFNYTQINSPTSKNHFNLIFMLVYHIPTGLLYSGSYSSSLTATQDSTVTYSHYTYVEELENFTVTPQLINWKIFNRIPSLVPKSSSNTTSSTTSTTSSTTPTSTATASKSMVSSSESDTTTNKVTTTNSEYLFGLLVVSIVLARRKRHS